VGGGLLREACTNDLSTILSIISFTISFKISPKQQSATRNLWDPADQHSSPPEASGPDRGALV
jgi:hypothetical protein